MLRTLLFQFTGKSQNIILLFCSYLHIVKYFKTLLVVKLQKEQKVLK